MARARKKRINEKRLTKGQLRKLNALRRSLGNEIADKAFGEWLDTADTERSGQHDAEVLAEALQPLLNRKALRIPLGAYWLPAGGIRSWSSPPLPENKSYRASS